MSFLPRGCLARPSAPDGDLVCPAEELEAEVRRLRDRILPENQENALRAPAEATEIIADWIRWIDRNTDRECVAGIEEHARRFLEKGA